MPRSFSTALLLTALTTAGLAGCTSDQDSAPAAQSTTAAHPTIASSPSASAPAKAVQPPSAVAGELSRVVLSVKDGHPDNTTTVLRNARAGKEYWLHAACTSTIPGTVLSYEIRSGKPGASDDALVSGEVPCDGTVTADGIGDLPAEPIVLDLRGDQTGVLSAYAIIAPTPDLTAQPNENGS